MQKKTQVFTASCVVHVQTIDAHDELYTAAPAYKPTQEHRCPASSAPASRCLLGHSVPQKLSPAIVQNLTYSLKTTVPKP